MAAAGARQSLLEIGGLWALATLPMALLGWVAFPLLAPSPEANPLAAGATRTELLTLGMMWSAILSLIVVYRDEGSLRWGAIARRLRLGAPRDAATGAPRRRLWLWCVPLLAAVALVELVLAPPLRQAWVSAVPFLAEPAGYSFDGVFKSRAILSQLAGAWWFFALFVVNAAFNTVLGEELFFRGALLPKTEGVFGRWGWVATGILFGLYHLHQPWGIPHSIITGLIYSFAAARFRSTWMSVILHSAQSVYLTVLVLGVVLGLAH